MSEAPELSADEKAMVDGFGIHPEARRAERVEQLAMFMQARDARLHGSILDDGAHPTWDELGIVAHEEYLNDASVFLAATQLLDQMWGRL